MVILLGLGRLQHWATEAEREVDELEAPFDQAGGIVLVFGVWAGEAAGPPPRAGTAGTDPPLTGAPLASSATTTSKQMLSMVPDEREGRNPSHRRRRAMRQIQINRKSRAVAARLRRQHKQVLPVSLRDPEVVRAKDLQRRQPP
jgi:hypothetical protein